MSNINFDTDKLIIVCFPQFAGGKFIINNLGLSNGCLFPHTELANNQLMHPDSVSFDSKFDFLLNKYVSDTELMNWRKLNSTWHNLFNANNIISPNPKNLDVIETVTNSDKYFFVICNDMPGLTSQLNLFKNAKIILLTNPIEFLKRKLANSSDTIQTLSDVVLSNISEFQIGNDILYTWDCDWFLDEQQTVSNINNLYNLLQLPDYNEDKITQYYRIYYNTAMKLHVL